MGRHVEVCHCDPQYRNNKVEVFCAQSFEKPQMNEIIGHVMQLKQRDHITRLYCEGANLEVIRELKRRIGEYQEYHDFTEEEIWSFRIINLSFVGDAHDKLFRQVYFSYHALKRVLSKAFVLGE